MALVATPGAQNANSYVTETEADAYFEGRVHATAWASATDAEQSLISASQMLDWYMSWDGIRAAETQIMEWPRANVYDNSGFLIDSTIIPVRIKQAVFELALFSLSEDRLADKDMDGFAEMKVGPLSLKSDASHTKSSKKRAIPKHVRLMLSDFVTTGRLIRA